MGGAGVNDRFECKVYLDRQMIFGDFLPMSVADRLTAAKC